MARISAWTRDAEISSMTAISIGRIRRFMAVLLMKSKVVTLRSLKNAIGYCVLTMVSTWGPVFCQSFACYRRWLENARSAQRGEPLPAESTHQGGFAQTMSLNGLQQLSFVHARL